MTDPKAGVISTYVYVVTGEVCLAVLSYRLTSGDEAVAYIVPFSQLFVSLQLFYDHPTPPSGIFDDFLAIPYLTKDVQTRSFLDLINAMSAKNLSGTR